MDRKKRVKESYFLLPQCMQVSNEVCKNILNSMSFFAKGHICCVKGSSLSCLVLQGFSLSLLSL